MRDGWNGNLPRAQTSNRLTVWRDEGVFKRLYRQVMSSAHWCWPSNCIICTRAGPPGRDICASCVACLPGLQLRERTRSEPIERAPAGSLAGAVCLCLQCGAPVSGRFSSAVCSRCASSPLPFADIVSPLCFRPPVDRLIHDLKYRARLSHARVLGLLLADAVRRSPHPRPDLVIAVPTHPTRRRERGFNQAHELARVCCSALDVTYRSDGARRIEATHSLSGLGRAERGHLIRGAFEVSPWVADRRVAIIDDVLTTGATTGELARELYDTGAADVSLWVVARTPLAVR